MKKGILGLSILAISALFFTSCKKNYTCVCTVNGNEVARQDLGKQKRSDAKDACDALYTLPGVVAKCELD